VVIGGGFTGASVAKQLQKEFHVTLIDSKEYFEFTPGILRVLVNPEHMKKIQVKHTEYLNRGKFICGNVSEVSKTHVNVNNKRINFDYLVIASGSNYSTPIKNAHAILASRGSILKRYHDKLKKASSVAIIGGGVVGVELASEICTQFPEKEITILESGERLIGRNHPRAIFYAHNFLQERGVRIIFNEIIKKENGKYAITNKETRIEGDLIFICTGIVRNSDFMKKHFSSKLAPQGAIKVDNYLRVKGEENIFTGGDITDIAEEKTAQSAEKQANVIVRNIRNFEAKKPLVTYHPKRRPMVISLGKWDGIFEYKNFVLTGILPAFMKAAVEWKTMWKYR